MSVRCRRAVWRLDHALRDLPRTLCWTFSKFNSELVDGTQTHRGHVLGHARLRPDRRPVSMCLSLVSKVSFPQVSHVTAIERVLKSKGTPRARKFELSRDRPKSTRPLCRNSTPNSTQVMTGLQQGRKFSEIVIEAKAQSQRHESTSIWIRVSLGLESG